MIGRLTPRPWAWLAAVAAWVGLISPATAGAIDAWLSAQSVGASQPVKLTLATGGPLPAPIDLSPLAADFHVVDQRRAETARTVDGRRSVRQELVLTLLPRRTGALTVPSIQVGDAASPPLALTVAAASHADAQLLPAPAQMPAVADPAPQAIEISAEISPLRAVVGQELVLRVEVSSPDGPPQGHLPTPRAADTRILPLGSRQALDAAGRHVFEQRFSLFPERTGRLRIDGIGFDAWQPAGGAPVRHRADPLQVAVTAPPPGIDPAAWLPARKVTLGEAGPAEVRLAPGQGVERMLTLRAEGLMAEDLPAIPLEIPFQLRVRDDPPRLWNERTPDGVVGFRAERILVSAPEPGVFVLPGPVIEWWDTGTATMQSAKLPDWTLTVAPFASENRRPAARWQEDTSDSVGTGDAADSPARPEAADGAGTTETTTGGIPWVGLLAAMAIAIALLVLSLRRGISRAAERRTRPRAPPATPSTEPQSRLRPDPATLVAAVRRAYAETDAIAARDALLAWSGWMWPQRPPRNLSQLVLRLEPPLRDDLKLLDATFYGPGDGAWAHRPVADRLMGLAPGGDPPPADTNADTMTSA